MALLTPTAVPGSAATAITFAACSAGGDTVAYRKDKLQVIIFKKGTGGADVTIAAARTSIAVGRDIAALSSITFNIGANTSRAVLVTPAYVGSNGMVAITYVGVSNHTVALLEL